MGEPIKTLYKEDHLAKNFQEWYRDRNFFYDINLAYFEDVTKATIVDFGCGDGSFLKECLAKGASSGLGLDISESMIKSGLNADKQHDASKQLRFVVQDCFALINDDYGRFDFASCQFVLHSCGSEEELRIFLKNVFRMLKPGGKVFVVNCPLANSLKDREVIEDLFGMSLPLTSDTNGKDPFFGQATAYRPASESGAAYTREPMFTFSEYYWSKEKLMQNLELAGFVKVKLLRFSSDEAMSFKAKQIDALEEPFIFIGAEKQIR